MRTPLDQDRLKPEHVRAMCEFFANSKFLSVHTVRIGNEPWPPVPQPLIRLNGLRRSKRFARLEVVR